MAGDLVLTGVTKRYAEATAVDALDLTVPQGAFFALLGPSGCGKTTTLRMVAGLESPTEGRVMLGEEDITHVKPYKRPVNTVFQNYALFPHLTVADNIAFGLRRRGRKDTADSVREMLALVELEDFGGRRPSQLSGGQQQRVALARALINRPQVLLLDEPLGALDLKLRRSMQLQLKQIQTEVGLTFVHVTHDQEEAMTMADTVAVMNRGVIEQMGPPEELYEKPRTTFVANFLGQSNLVRGRVVEHAGSDLLTLDLHGAKVRAPRPADGKLDGDVLLGVRPEKVRLVPDGAADSAADGARGENVLPGGRVVDVSFIGVSTQYLVRMPWGQSLGVFAQNSGAAPAARRGDEVAVAWLPEHGFLLDAAQDADAGLEEDGT